MDVKKFYWCKSTLMVNGKLYKTDGGLCRTEEDKGKSFTEIENITWDNINPSVNFMINPNVTKDQIFYWDDKGKSHVILKRKCPVLDMQIVHEYKEYVPTIEDLLKYPADEVISYLKYNFIK